MATAWAVGMRLTAARLNAATNAGSTTVEATQSTLGTVTSTSYTNTLATAGVFGISFTAPPSGIVDIDFGCRSSNATTNGNCWTSISVKTGSTIGSGSAAGSPTVSANDQWAVSQQSGVGNSDASGAIATKTVYGLTPGSTYNVSLEHKTSGGGGTFLNRYVKVRPNI